MEFTRINPVTGEPASSAAAMKAADIGPVASRAQQGFAAHGAQDHEDLARVARRQQLADGAHRGQGMQAGIVAGGNRGHGERETIAAPDFCQYRRRPDLQAHKKKAPRNRSRGALFKSIA